MPIQYHFSVVLSWTLIRHHFSESMSKIRHPCLLGRTSPQAGKSRPVYRVLEVGAGTGTFSKPFIEGLLSHIGEESDLEYYYTDVTSAFFKAAEKKFEKYTKSIVFKKFDMESDPLEQGFCPGYFDTIMGSEVFHVAKNIRETIKSVRSLLKPGGLIQLFETVYPDEAITFHFGLLDGYWQFKDTDLRKNHTTLTPQQWEDVLTSSGFQNVSFVMQCDNHHAAISAIACPLENAFLKDLRPQKHSWIVFGDTEDDLTTTICNKLSNVNRKYLIVPQPILGTLEEDKWHLFLKDLCASALKGDCKLEGIVYMWPLLSSTRDQKQVSLPFVTLCKLLLELRTPAKTFVAMRGVCAMDSSETVDPTPGTLVGFCRSLANENTNLNITYLDLDPYKETLDQVDELFANLWVEHKQGAAFRNGLRYCPKFTSAKFIGNEPLTLPSGCDRFQLQLPKTRMISDLEFIHLEQFHLNDNEVEVQVKAIALNFRDVFAVLKPLPIFDRMNTIGMDFSGVVTNVGANVKNLRVGDRVVGMNTDEIGLCFPSHIKIFEKRVVKIPGNMTYAEASTLPAVFSTAITSLIDVAKMKRGETALIHAASGGVGLLAIQLCQHMGVDVIATAGSARKRNFLRNLGVKHVFHSRSTDFKEDVLKVTGGRGVDIVLNSLTGQGFKEASLDCLAKNGRFIEMSKLNIWNEAEVKALRSDVYYEIVDLSCLQNHEYEELMSRLGEYMSDGIVNPVPYDRFDGLNIRGALKYLQQAKHIGKIVCVMPEIKLENSQLVASTPLFNDVSTYVITGGLGGIGFAVAKWMLKTGAKHIALVGRSAPKPEVASEIEQWNRAGNNVKIFSVDVGNYNQCKAFFEELKKPELGFPPVRGIMHSAGVLADASLENQRWDSFMHTYNPKVFGSWNLHDLTKEYRLEHFVLFSSMAGILGTPGQTNHSASCAFEDCLAAYRRSNGLPAISVNWGNWGEVGVATEIDFPGVRPISTAQGLLALETFMKIQMGHAAVMNVDSFSQLQKMFPQVKYFLDDHRLLGETKATMLKNSDDFWNEVESAEDRDNKLDCLKRFIKTVVRNVLKLNEDENIDSQMEFQTLGVDSLMMLEIKNGIQFFLGKRMSLTSNQLKVCANIDELANLLVNNMEGKCDSDKCVIPEGEDLQQLILDDCNLLPDRVSGENLMAKPIDQVETVLLTGATGNLGPYLLKDIIQRAQIKKVFCLVRPTKKLSGEEKLMAALKNLSMNVASILDKVEVVEGDISVDEFGLDRESYFELCEKVEAVIHNAALADHLAPYWKAPEKQKNNLRAVNVLGTVRVLEFAATSTLKHVFHSSTLANFVGNEVDGKFSEGWDAVSPFASSKLIRIAGYTVSKYIAEQLVHKALLQKVPCKTFRFPHVAGDSQTGRFNYSQNHISLRWLKCMKEGAIHDVPAPLLALPVDHCAKISLDIFFNPEAPMDVYNVVQSNISSEQVLLDVAKELGVDLKTVSYPEFVGKMKSEEENSPMVAFSTLYSDDELAEMEEDVQNPPDIAFRRFSEGGTNLFDTSRLRRFSKGYEDLVEDARDVLIRDFGYLKDAGVFEKYGIKSNNNCV